MIKINKKIIIFLIGFILLFSFVAFFNSGINVYAENNQYYLFSGKEDEVVFSKPKFLADEQAYMAVNNLPESLMCTSPVAGYFELKAYTGYLYGAMNLKFKNPILDASKIKKINIDISVNMFGSDDIIYINEAGEGSVPYFRLYPVNDDDFVNTDRFFSFNDLNVSEVGKRVTVSLDYLDIQNLINNKGGIEKLQWSFYHTKMFDPNGFANFTIYNISYEFFDISDVHVVTYYIDNKPIYSQSTYYLTQPPKIGYTGSNIIWKDKNGNVFDFSKKVTKDIDLFLNYEKSLITLSFNSNLGSEIDPIIAKSGASIEKPIDPIREGYEFAGWYEDKDFTIKFTFDKMPNVSKTLYAKWIIKDVNIPVENDVKNSGCSSVVYSNYVCVFVSIGFLLLTSYYFIRRRKNEK